MSTILHLEDEIAFHDFAREMFEDMGYTYIPVVDMNTAIQYLKEHVVNYVVTDYQVQKGNGALFIEELLKMGLNIPIIGNSAFYNYILKEAGADYSCDHKAGSPEFLKFWKQNIEQTD